MTVDINGMEINYIDIGEGQPILLLHGWGSSTDVWRMIIENLKERYRLIALDFPGCGKSSIPENPLNLDDYTDLVIKFTEKLNITEPIIMGHSNGGRVAISLMGRHLLKVKKAVLLDSAGIYSKKSPKKAIKIAAFKTVKFFLTLPVIKDYTTETLNNARKYFGSSDYNNAPLVMRQTLVALVNTDLSDILKDIDCPTLLIWGENDSATPLSDGKKMEKLIPDAGLCVLNGCSHFSFIERPGDTNAILNSFLNN